MLNLGSTLLPEDTRNLVFIEPRTSDPFIFREYTVTRTGFPISHARAITSTACQGRTMRDGVIIDCGRHGARVCHVTPSNSSVLNNVVRSDDIMVDYEHDSGPMTEHMTIVSSLGWTTVAS